MTWIDQRIDKSNRDGDRDHSEKQKNYPILGTTLIYQKRMSFKRKQKQKFPKSPQHIKYSSNRTRLILHFIKGLKLSNFSQFSLFWQKSPAMGQFSPIFSKWLNWPSEASFWSSLTLLPLSLLLSSISSISCGLFGEKSGKQNTKYVQQVYN